MNVSMASLVALMLCTSVTARAAVNAEAGPAVVASRFVDALHHHRFKDAAHMFAPGARRDAGLIERDLQRIDDQLGGFAALHSVAALPNGKSVRVQISADGTPSSNGQKFAQLRYVSTARDGQPVFYELNLTADKMMSRILSLGLHFPGTAPGSSERANQMVNAIHR